MYEEYRVGEDAEQGVLVGTLRLDDLPRCLYGHHCLARDDDRLKQLNSKQFTQQRCQTCNDIKITPVLS